MSPSHTNRRQRSEPLPAFSTVNLSSFLCREVRAAAEPRSTFVNGIRPQEARGCVVRTEFAIKTSQRPHAANAHAEHPRTLMVAAPPPSLPKKAVSRQTRFTRPVPAAKPHEIMPPRRGRNSKKRVREAEHFRKYMVLRRQLKPWSDDFRAKHGRTPTLLDVHESDIPGLLDRFVEYLDALDSLRLDDSGNRPSVTQP